jgi:hypothetical protein
VRVIRDPETHIGKGFGFLEFENANDKIKVLKSA